MDASIRFLYTGNISHTKSQLLQSGGMLGMVRSGHSVFVATHEKIYSFFPADIEKMKHTGKQPHVSTLP